MPKLFSGENFNRTLLDTLSENPLIDPSSMLIGSAAHLQIQVDVSYRQKAAVNIVVERFRADQGFLLPIGMIFAIANDNIRRPFVFENLRFGKVQEVRCQILFACFAAIAPMFRVHGLSGFWKVTLIRNSTGSKLCSSASSDLPANRTGASPELFGNVPCGPFLVQQGENCASFGEGKMFKRSCGCGML